MMRRPRAPALRACAAAALLAASHAAAHAAQPSAGTPEVAVRLEPGRVRVSPGGAARIALRLVPARGWHVYATDPGGDVGLPLRVEWEAPEGVRVTPLAWPAATRIGMGEWTSLVYSEAVQAEGEIRVAADATPGTTLRLVARVAWAACRDVCRRGNARLTLEVDVVAATRAALAPPAPHGAGNALQPPPAAPSPSGSTWSRLASSSPSSSITAPMRTRSGPSNGARSTSSISTPGRRFSLAR